VFLQHLLATPEAAHYVGLSASFLNKLRGAGGGPGYVKLGRRVLYPKAELDSWIEACRRKSTSDAGCGLTADSSKALPSPQDQAALRSAPSPQLLCAARLNGLNDPLARKRK
jgi:excisionase family DNA binding protein